MRSFLPLCVSVSSPPLAFSCRLMPVVCLCSEVMLELALLSALTHLQLRQRNSSPQLNTDSSVTEVFVWRVSRLLVGPLSIPGEMKVGGLCRSVLLQYAFNLFIQFVIFVSQLRAW